MSDPANHTLEAILRACAAHAPQPWYPQVEGLGIPREQLEPSLDALRLGGLIRLTDWVQGKGQGYALTPAGAKALESPYVLGRLRKGDVPVAREEPVDPIPERASMTFRRGEHIRKALMEPLRPRVTLALLYLNIAVFLVGCVLSWQRLGSPEPFILARLDDPQVGKAVGQILLDTGAISAPAIFPAQHWWRLLTCCFVHIGVLHLVVNMWSLWMVGPLLENLWGRWNYLAIYLVSGLCGSCAMAALERGLGAGASGALWGILASLASWVFLNRRALSREMVRFWANRLVVVFVLNLVITFGVPNVSAAGHLGGGLAGLLAAFPVDFARYHKGWRRYLALAGLPFLFVAFLSFFLQWYAAPSYVPLLERADKLARSVYLGEGLDAVLNTESSRRRITNQTLESIDELRQRLREVGSRRWVLLFAHPPVREQAERGVELLDAWEGLFDRLSRFASARDQWSQADEAELVEQRRHLLSLVRR
jgi:rhomboid protease GluP